MLHLADPPHRLILQTRHGDERIGPHFDRLKHYNLWMHLLRSFPEVKHVIFKGHHSTRLYFNEEALRLLYDFLKCCPCPASLPMTNVALSSISELIELQLLVTFADVELAVFRVDVPSVEIEAQKSA